VPVTLITSLAYTALMLAVMAKWRKQKIVRFIAGTACCWVACMTTLSGHILIDEAIVGVDAGTPFHMTSGDNADLP